jgi:hypothetical protein
MFRRPNIIIQKGETVYQDRLVPIDASHAATLLNDVEKIASERVTKAVRIENNSLNVLFQSWQDHATDTLVGRLTFDINGHRIVIDDNVSGYSSGAEKLLEKLQAKAAARIAVEVIMPAFHQAMQGGVLK